MRSADDYRKLAEGCRQEMALSDGPVREALRRLAQAYDQQADAMDGKRR